MINLIIPMAPMIMLSLIVNLIAKLSNLSNLNLIIIIMDLTFNTGAYLAFTSPTELYSIT